MIALPSGTVTFLFTDIEGSTRLWERDRLSMRAVVERHAELLRESALAHHGVLYKMVGDGTQSAFASAPSALAAAVDAQEALSRESWPDPPGPIRVRMALHAGDAEPHAGDYLAAPLNRLARLLEHSLGGQILLTETVQQLVQDSLSPEVSLRDLGEFHLRDVLRPERVYALVHPAFGGNLLTIASPDERLRGFPAALTPFLGRASEVRAVVALLLGPGTRLVTLVGPGGIGKTRLAIQVGTIVAEKFPDGAVFTDLASLHDPALVLPAVAAALGLREGPGRSLAEVVASHLRERQLLLILDNFEHLAEAATVVRDLIATSPGVKALITSREPLRLRGEQEYPVSPLNLPIGLADDPLSFATNEAVLFFVEYAQAMQPDFVLTAETAPVIAAICSKLDGLPLAIELAAARIKLLPPQALLARLEHRLPLLTTGARDAPQRQRTLSDTIAWSYDLLQEPEQRLFRRMSVFAGGWTLEAAEAISNSSSELDIFSSLASLVDKSLVRQSAQPDGQPRFGMLQTIREYGLEQLHRDVEEERVTQRAHATFFADMVIGSRRDLGAGAPNAIARMTVEQDNVRAMLAWLLDSGETETALNVAASLSEFWTFTGGRFREGREWLGRALALGKAASPSARANAQYGVALMALHQGEVAIALAAAAEALAIARSANDDYATISALYMLSNAKGSAGHVEESLQLADEAVQLARAMDDPEWLDWVLFLQGMAHHGAGDLAMARARLEEALRLAHRLEDHWCEADTLTYLALVVSDQGDLAYAARLQAQALSLRRGIGAGLLVPVSLIGLAEIATKVGRHETAAWLLGAAQAHYKFSGGGPFRDIPTRAEWIEATVRLQLGPEAFRLAVDRGQGVIPDDAISEAIGLAQEISGVMPTPQS